MNLTSTGLGMLGLRWPHYKGGLKGQVGCSCESRPTRASGQHEAWEGERRVSVRWVPGPAGTAPRRCLSLSRRPGGPGTGGLPSGTLSWDHYKGQKGP